MKDSKQIIWENVSALMAMRYGGENLWRCAKDAGVGPATMTRLKEQHTSIGTDTLEKLAKLFNVEPYELLMPGLTTKEVVLLQHMRDMCEDQRDTLLRISTTLAEPKEVRQKK